MSNQEKQMKNALRHEGATAPPRPKTETKQMKNALRHEGATAPPRPKTKMSNGEKWVKLVEFIKETHGDEDADIWDFLGDTLGVEPDGSQKCEQ